MRGCNEAFVMKLLELEALTWGFHCCSSDCAVRRCSMYRPNVLSRMSLNNSTNLSYFVPFLQYLIANVQKKTNIHTFEERADRNPGQRSSATSLPISLDRPFCNSFAIAMSYPIV